MTIVPAWGKSVTHIITLRVTLLSSPFHIPIPGTPGVAAIAYIRALGFAGDLQEFAGHICTVTLLDSG